ncbi:MAG: NADH-quinone oxidoreductase subunit NuoK [Planctomycetota bacterium]|nr:NADH-quinone oxidoreductase subunit NuoK [Planctomycetota bacterium]
MHGWLLLGADELSHWLGNLLTFRLASCLALAGALFAIGAWGVLARRNVLLVLISVELMLNAVMLAFVAFARAHVNLAHVTGRPYAGESGQIFALSIIALAAAEAAVGLAIVIAYFRNKGSVDTREISSMRG